MWKHDWKGKRRWIFRREKRRKNDHTSEIRQNVLAPIWKENAVDATDKNGNEDSNISETVGGSGNTKQEGENVFGISHKQLAPATFELPEN